MKLILSESAVQFLTEGMNINPLQYPHQNMEHWAPNSVTAVATTPPRMSKEYKSGYGLMYIYEITRIAFVAKRTADQYIRLIDFGEGATGAESESRQSKSVDDRAKMEVDSVNNFYGIGYTEKQAKFKFWESWKIVFPTTLLITEHQSQNDLY